MKNIKISHPQFGRNTTPPPPSREHQTPATPLKQSCLVSVYTYGYGQERAQDFSGGGAQAGGRPGSVGGSIYIQTRN